MDKIQRATEIHRSMTPHQMALRIVELEDIAEIVGKSASERANRITELQGALELAEEAVRAKHQAAPGGWQLVPVSPTAEMLKAAAELPLKATRGMHDTACYKLMLAADPKLGGE